MRRHDREVTDPHEIMDIIRRCRVCRLAFFDEGYPYIIPLNFGVTAAAGQTVFYFHCAKEGKKLDLMRKNPHVGFELDIAGRYVEGHNACDTTMGFESVCGRGVLECIPEVEKLPALRLIMGQYSAKAPEELTFDEAAVRAVAVLKLTVLDMTAKRLTV
jgi:nitroimidazol reductase NimA-like FMN-containing flavoprotein (pyridoxamine 5'-phosphate oxidase superfamily)